MRCLVLIVLAIVIMPLMVPRAEAKTPFFELLALSKRVLLGERGTFLFTNGDLSWNFGRGEEGKKKTIGDEKGRPKSAIDFQEVEREAEYASQLTGVRKEFLMGSLAVESKLGENTGQCTYKEVADGARDSYEAGRLSEAAWVTFLERRDTLTGIAEDLGYDPQTIKVSCNPDPALYAGTGGAMGLPQFMPDTWLEYKERLSKVTGKEHPDPWNVRDGVLAMALKLSDVPGVTEHDPWSERRASKLYLSGTTSWQYNWYAEEIQYWAANYQSLIASIAKASKVDG